jgi:hypothetical protein
LILVSVVTPSSSIEPPKLQLNELDNIRLKSDPSCPFIRSNYRCDIETVNAKWKSCCADESCLDTCGSGQLRANSQVLFMGNSYIREIAEAIVCQNLYTLVHVTFMPNNSTSVPAMMMNGYNPSLLTWTYSPEDELRDENHSTQIAGPDDVATYAFANGARIHVAVNMPVILTPAETAGHLDSPFTLESISSYLGFDFADLDGVVANEGNGRSWAYKSWCTGDISGIETKIPKFEDACDHLRDKSRAKDRVINIPNLMKHLSKTGFQGKAIITSNHMEDKHHNSPLSRTLLTSLPFSANYIDMQSFLVNRECAYSKCRKAGGHMCLPGPPDDAAQIFLHSIYSKNS